MYLHLKRYFLFVFLLACLGKGFCEDGIRIKGYYQEDGSYVKQRVIEPIPWGPGSFSSLRGSMAKDRKFLEKFYEGKIVKTRISFPACHSGIIVYADDPGKTNVDIFRKVKKHGASIEKGHKAILTKVKIKPNSIDIWLNDGGYGTIGQKVGRGFLGIVSLGLTELRDYDELRMRAGSRLRIKSKKKFIKNDDSIDFIPKDLKLAKFKKTLKTKGKANQIILDQMGIKPDQLKTLKEDRLLTALNVLLDKPDLHAKIKVKKIKLPWDIKPLLSKVKNRALAGAQVLKAKEIRVLNKATLRSLYPSAIQKNFNNLDTKRIKAYLDLAFEL